jgi:hypothetical protein
MRIHWCFGVFLLLFAVLPATASARVVRTAPVTFIVSDDYNHFMGPTVKTRYGNFDICLGECHEGDPGFGQSEPGSPFYLALVIYKLEPRRTPLPYFIVKTWDLAQGKFGRTVYPLKNAPRRITYKGVTFEVKILKLSPQYGSGRTRIQVTVRDR